MSLLSACAHRVREPELMDDPQLDRQRHYSALRGLASLNRISGSTKIVWSPIRRLAKQSSEPLRVLDLGTGGGDVPIGLWKKSKRENIDLELLGLDLSDRAIEFARQSADQCGARVDFETLDTLHEDLPEGFDVIMCSLFLHHLSESEAVLLLQKMSAAAERLVLVNDLVRGPLNLLLVRLGAWLFTRSDVARVDGPLSVKAAFTLEEVRGLAREANLDGARIVSRPPCRFLLEWSKR